MPLVHFIDFNAGRTDVEATEGTSLMRAATDRGVPGIDGDCGGQCACATCHVYIDEPWASRLPAMGDTENSMLEFTNERRATSRLACQIPLTAELDGIEVHTPEGQH
jgi:2Fe-2S ferredoxin